METERRTNESHIRGKTRTVPNTGEMLRTEWDSGRTRSKQVMLNETRKRIRGTYGGGHNYVVTSVRSVYFCSVSQDDGK